MFVLTGIVSLVVPAAALIAHPLPTPPPSLDARQVGDNVCGYFSSDATVNTISCSVGSPCMVATNLAPAVGYCLGSGANGNVPITTGFPYGDWPIGGCGPGQVCCPAAEPSVGKYLFDGGKTVFLACSTVDFTYMASVSNGASLVPTLPIQPSSAMGSVTTTPPGTLSTTTPAASTTPPAQDGTGSSSGSSSSDDGNNGKDTVEIVAIVVGGVVCLVAFLFTGYIALRIWQIHNSRYTPMTPTMSHSSAAQEPREPLNTWAKVAGVGSFLVGLAGLVVAIYFGIRHS